jgi:dTDP-4-dehydrorhamnose reductase
VFSRHGGNFVKTMLRLGSERDEIRVVDDQRGCPTAAGDIAAAIAAIGRRVLAGGGEGPWGTYHYAGGEAVSWFAFAEAIFGERQAATGKAPPRLTPIATAEYPTAARRPANSVLDCSKAAAVFGVAPSDWRRALHGIVGELCHTNRGKV